MEKTTAKRKIIHIIENYFQPGLLRDIYVTLE